MNNASSPFHSDLIDRALMGFVFDCMEELTSEQYIVEFHPVPFGGVKVEIRSRIVDGRYGMATAENWERAMANAIRDLDSRI